MSGRSSGLARSMILLSLGMGNASCGPPGTPSGDPPQAPGTAPPVPGAESQPAAAGTVSLQEVRDRYDDTARSGQAGGEWQEFLDAFGRSDWMALDGDEDRKLAEDGLLGLALRALDRRDDATAARAMEFMAAQGLGSQAQVLETATTVYARRGDLALAEAAAERFTRADNARPAAGSFVRLGDVRSARGDLDGARAAWRGAAKVPRPDDPDDWLRPAQKEAELRLRSVGQPVPSLEAEGDGPSEWVVGGPLAADALKGRVAVVLPFDTACMGCRSVLRALQELHERRAAQGLLVIGLLRPQSEGLLPHPGARHPWLGGRHVEIPPDGMRDHVAAFARDGALTFSMGLVSDRTWSSWCLPGSHPLLVVGPEGRVEFLVSAGDSLELLRVTVDRLLAAQPR